MQHLPDHLLIPYFRLRKSLGCGTHRRRLGRTIGFPTTKSTLNVEEGTWNQTLAHSLTFPPHFPWSRSLRSLIMSSQLIARVNHGPKSWPVDLTDGLLHFSQTPNDGNSPEYDTHANLVYGWLDIDLDGDPLFLQRQSILPAGLQSGDGGISILTAREAAAQFGYGSQWFSIHPVHPNLGWRRDAPGPWLPGFGAIPLTTTTRLSLCHMSTLPAISQ